MKFGVFGRKETVDRFRQLLPREEIEMVPFIYTKVEETTELLQTVFQCDVYIFTEYLSYLYVEEAIESKRLPTVLVKLDPYRMIASLYRLQAERNDKHQRIAMDVYDESLAKKIVNELKINEQDFHYFVHSSEKPNLDKAISYYTALWNDGKIDYVLASSEEITLALEKIRIPARTIAIPNFYLTKVIQEAIALVQLSESENNQLVTGLISIKGLDENTDSPGNRLDSMDKIRRILTNFTKSTDASFIETADQQFMIHGSDKLLRHLKEHYRHFPLLQEMKRNIPLPILLGFGLGLNARESEESAEIAIDNCMQSDSSICYIVNERQEVIGPIGVKKEINTSSLYRALIHDARLNNALSYHFIDFINDRNNEPFSTNDVALFYQVTKRSAERTVSKLLSGDVIKITGEERPYKKGRPRKLFSLNQ